MSLYLSLYYACSDHFNYCVQLFLSFFSSFLFFLFFSKVILPLYPQFSISTSGSSLRVLNEEFTKRPEQWSRKNVVHTVVPSYHDRPGYIKAMANLVAKEVDQFSPEERMEGVQVRQSSRSWAVRSIKTI